MDRLLLVFLALLLIHFFAPREGFANHWPAPFEYLNGTSDHGRTQCEQPFGWPPWKLVGCHVRYDKLGDRAYILYEVMPNDVQFVERWDPATEDWWVFIYPTSRERTAEARMGRQSP